MREISWSLSEPGIHRLIDDDGDVSRVPRFVFEIIDAPFIAVSQT